MEQATDFFVEVGTDDIAQLVEIHSLLQACAESPEAKAWLAQLRDLKVLPHESPLRFLGYFSLLESLLTHAPDPTDQYQSITRQICKKLALINHRLPRPLDYSSFGGADAEKIWKKMYKCRSEVAHGGRPDFEKDLKILNSHDHALGLIKETAKAIIQQAFREPQLLADLRDC